MVSEVYLFFTYQLTFINLHRFKDRLTFLHFWPIRYCALRWSIVPPSIWLYTFIEILLDNFRYLVFHRTHWQSKLLFLKLHLLLLLSQFYSFLLLVLLLVVELFLLICMLFIFYSLLPPHFFGQTRILQLSLFFDDLVIF